MYQEEPSPKPARRRLPGLLMIGGAVVLLASGVFIGSRVVGSGAPVIAPANASQKAARVPASVPTGHFTTLPPGSALPSDAECSSRVRPAEEVRSVNAVYNQTKGHGTPSNPPAGVYSRVTGNFTGTTDEIIQWASCKWGIDEDIVRAQTAKESWWRQDAVGDGGESFGLQQVREPYWAWAFNNGVGDAKSSSAFNMDAALAARRNCFEGNDGWLNTVERGKDYAAGDIWGCVGTWFSGRWYTQPSVEYIAAVQDYLNQRIWETPGFING